MQDLTERQAVLSKQRPMTMDLTDQQRLNTQSDI